MKQDVRCEGYNVFVVTIEFLSILFQLLLFTPILFTNRADRCVIDPL